jgi:hypothetical protein
MEDVDDKVREAVDALYLAFADQPVPPPISGCSHCFEEHELDLLLSKPPRELTAEELSSYASSAFLTAGDIPDYLYLLPRIIDLTLNHSSFWPDIEITARAIRDSGFETWPEARRQSLLTVFHAYLDHLLEGEYVEFDIDGMMCALGRLGVSLGPFLAKIRKYPEKALAYRDINAETLGDGKLTNAFWDPLDPGQEEIVAWFNSPQWTLS